MAKRGNPRWCMNAYLASVPALPSSWDRQLFALRLTEPEALQLLRERSDDIRILRLRAWIFLRGRQCFVPESALTAVGMDDAFTV